MRCQNCGLENVNEARFCRSCGAPIAQPQQYPQQQPQQMPQSYPSYGPPPQQGYGASPQQGYGMPPQQAQPYYPASGQQPAYQQMPQQGYGAPPYAQTPYGAPQWNPYMGQPASTLSAGARVAALILSFIPIIGIIIGLMWISSRDNARKTTGWLCILISLSVMTIALMIYNASY